MFFERVVKGALPVPTVAILIQFRSGIGLADMLMLKLERFALYFEDLKSRKY